MKHYKLANIYQIIEVMKNQTESIDQSIELNYFDGGEKDD